MDLGISWEFRIQIRRNKCSFLYTNSSEIPVKSFSQHSFNRPTSGPSSQNKTSDASGDCGLDGEWIIYEEPVVEVLSGLWDVDAEHREHHGVPDTLVCKELVFTVRIN
jgi:hypothetical protein